MSYTFPSFTVDAAGPWGDVKAPAAVDFGIDVLFSWGLKVFFFGLALAVLFYLLLGAFSYVTAGGDEEKLKLARNQIIHSLVGAFVGIAMLVVWGVMLFITGNPFIQINTTGGYTMCLPTIKGNACDFTAPPHEVKVPHGN